MMDEENGLPDFKDLEIKLGRKVPESLIRSFADRGVKTVNEEKKVDTPVTVKNHTSDLKRLESKMLFLKQEMAHLRAIDVKLMHQLLTINEGIESIRWVMEERAGVASRESSMTGSTYSLTDSMDGSSHRGSCNSLHDCSDSLDGISVGSYLDTLGEDLEEDLGEDIPSRPSQTDLNDGFPEKNTKVDDEDMIKKPQLLRPRVESDEYYIFG